MAAAAIAEVRGLADRGLAGASVHGQQPGPGEEQADEGDLEAGVVHGLEIGLPSCLPNPIPGDVGHIQALIRPQVLDEALGAVSPTRAGIDQVIESELVW